MTGSHRFGDVEIRPAERRLLIGGKPVSLGARAFDTLLALVERRERVVTKNELFDLVWPGLVVEENNLQVQVSTLRKLLGPQVIATIPGRGYRFAATIDGAATQETVGAAQAPSPVAARLGEAPGRLTNLPKELPPLYGRDVDRAALSALIDQHRLVTVVGAGGIGKSRLAQAVAHSRAGHWPDGAWMVELAGLSDAALVPNAVARALGIAIGDQDAVSDQLVAGLAPRHLLLVLDNCEHLLDAAAALVQALLQGAPNVTVLSTSQEPLHLAAEQQYRLLPLAVPAESDVSGARDFGALSLFEARVQAAQPGFVLDERNLALAIDVCRRLDGLPLAIELAAARVATLGLRSVRDKLDARFKLLTAGSRAALRRHQTLRAALEWSHGLLTDAERAVFQRLGVFAGGFTMHTAQAVAADARLDEWIVLDHLSALVDKSLVVTDAGDPPRYGLLESARAFALEQLAAAGETIEVVKRHALAMRDFLQRVDSANLDGELRTDQYAALVLPELDNLRAAHEWASGEAGDLQVAMSLAAHAGSLIDYAVECADWLVSLHGKFDEDAIEPAIVARYWRAIAAGNMTGRLPLAQRADAAARASTLYKALHQPRRVFSSLMQLSQLRSAQGQIAAAQAAVDGARALMRPDWPAEFRIRLLRRDGYLARTEGRWDEALAAEREDVRISAATGDWRLEVIARTNLVDLLWERGPIEEAAHEASRLAEQLRERPAAQGDMDIMFANLIGILSEMDRIEDAAIVAQEALPSMRRTRNLYIEEWVYFFWRRGQVETASLLLGAYEAKRARTGEPLQPNERRLIAQARAAIETGVQAEPLRQALAAGAALGDLELLSVITDALALPSLPRG